VRRSMLWASLLAVVLFSLPLLGGRVAILVDVGGTGDLSFNDMAVKGAEEAAEEFGWEVSVIEPATAADYLPNVRLAAESRMFDMIICVGFLLADALETVAPDFPDQPFAIIDAVVDEPNVLSVEFREEEGSALVGALGAMLAAHYDYPYAGIVLGIEIPVLYQFEGGYRYGINWGAERYWEETGEEADVDLLWVYTGTFDDIARGKSAAEVQIGEGAAVVYNVAGPLGMGILEAVTEHLEARDREAGPPFMFGVDANQDWMGDGNKIIASMLKRVDVAAYTAVELVELDEFEGGVMLLGLEDKGVGISRHDDLIEFIEFGIAAGEITEDEREQIEQNWLAIRGDVPDWIWDAVDELEEKILAGEIEVPRASSRGQIDEVRELYP